MLMMVMLVMLCEESKSDKNDVKNIDCDDRNKMCGFEKQDYIFPAHQQEARTEITENIVYKDKFCIE